MKDKGKTHDEEKAGWSVGGGRDKEGLRHVNDLNSRHRPSHAEVGIAPFQHVLSKSFCLTFEFENSI